MSSLTDIDKLYLEQILDMGSGYVLHFSDRTFGEFFDQHGIDIHSLKYQIFGTSKANKLRAFWKLEDDQKVGTVLSTMLNLHEANCDLRGQEIDRKFLDKVQGIVRRLNGKAASVPHSATTDSEFLAQDFTVPNIQKMPTDACAVPIIEARLREARVALTGGAHLSVIFLCGSVLEAILLGAAQKSPARFNQANGAPKTAKGSPKRFHEWSLAQLIDVAYETGILELDVKKFSHGLRDFRNYIHPYQQMASGFTPDKHTAEICFQVLKAALASVAGER